ncbi:substrate-binding periplasmic protein [Maridesulfovibrio ferrireducens]|nr:transporter substrate-binding domain-containing protein [Maridesulfovibrio ferrireducens]
MAENHPPYNYKEDGIAKGIVYDLVCLIMENVGESETNIVFVPWARGYRSLENGSGDVLFSMARTPERENKFKFVGPVFKTSEFLYRKKGSNVNVVTIDDAKAVSKIGVVRSTFPHQVLAQKGFTNLDAGSSYEAGFHKLLKGRVDLISISDEMLQRMFIDLPDLDSSMFERVGPPICSASGYIAFGLHVPDTVVLEWQKALDELKESGEYQKIVDKYLNLHNE